MESNIVVKIIVVLVPMLLSLTVHEYAHALAAYKLGDSTASEMGRMTLNPISHIDLFGTLIIPVFAVVSGFNFLFGWAKPVPINPLRFDKSIDMRKGMAITALAGPFANVLLAFLATGALKLYIISGFNTADNQIFIYIFQVMIYINVILAIFNLIPLPPLDGSRVVTWLLPRDKIEAYNNLQRYSFIIILGMLFLFGKYLGMFVTIAAGLLFQLFGI